MNTEPRLPTPTIEAKLDEAMSRLDLALRRATDGSAALSFGMNMPEPECALLASLEPAAGGPSPSFSTDVGASGADEGTAAGLLDELIERVLTRARVQTELEGSIVASTRVGRSGDIISSVAPTLEPEQLVTHLSALRQALADQRERALLLLSTLRMATKIAVAVGTGAPLLAIPVAWRFIRGIMAEHDHAGA